MATAFSFLFGVISTPCFKYFKGFHPFNYDMTCKDRAELFCKQT